MNEGMRVIEGALAIGWQANLAVSEAETRLSDSQQQAATPTSVDEHPLFVKIHGWLVGAL
jgi:hypothetical protein